MLKKLTRNWQLVLFALTSFALVLVSFYGFSGHSLKTLFLILSAVLLVYVACIDLRDKEVDWRLLTVGLASGILAGGYHSGFNWYLLIALGSSAIIPLLLVGLSHEKWMGWGDVLIAAWVGALCGYPYSLIAIFFAFLAGALSGIIYKGSSRDTNFAFGPFLLIGCLYSLMLADKVIFWYFSLS